MTPWQTLAVAAIGGFAALTSIIIFVALALGTYTAIARLIDLHDTHREHRRTLTKARRQLNALPTTHHPNE